MNVQQVYQLLLNNGATQQEAATLAGISVWEAGGGNPNAINPQALNPQAPDYSVGLFQYNFRAGNFIPSNPTASTRGGFSVTDLLGSVDAQAQSALALLRGSTSGFRNWTTYGAHFQSIQQYVQQLIGTSQPGTTIGPTDTGGTTTVNPTSPVQTDTTTGATTTVTGGANVPPTGLNLSFGGSVQHVVFQFLLLLVGLALLLGGVYLLGSHK
jgi:hypothetical protein